MKRLLFIVALGLLSGCGPIESDESTDPAQAQCESRGGDYFCKGFHPDGSLDCTCIMP